MADSFFKRVAEDLLHLEVNTIVKSQMSGQKMPDSSRETLYDIAGTYDGELRRLGRELVPDGDPSFPDAANSGFRHADFCHFGGVRAFHELKDCATAGMKWMEEQSKNGTANIGENTGQVTQEAWNRMHKMLQRMKDNSHRIIGMFMRLAAVQGLGKEDVMKYMTPLKDASGKIIPFPSDDAAENISWNNDINREKMNELNSNQQDLDVDIKEMMMLKKAWDLGVEEIMVQTIVGIDGDVTTRILERFVQKPDDTILGLHNDGVKTSIGFWNKIVDTITTIVGSTLAGILGKKDD